MRKSSHPTQNYRSGCSRGPIALATFQQQMADYARGELLRELREARHESQEHVAFTIGVSTKTVRTWEAGGKIRWPNAQKIARYYGRNPEELVSRDIPEAIPAGQHATLDEIEAKLDEILSYLRGDEEHQGLREALAELDTRNPGSATHRAGATTRAKGSRRAS